MTAQAFNDKAQSSAIALFVSDVHLNSDHPETAQAFLDFLEHHVPRQAQLYLLGDIFEYWVGDDDLDDMLHTTLIAALKKLSDTGTTIFWMAGNRDFLVGETFATMTGTKLLNDPACISVAGREILLCHGDSLCTDDTDYMRFRQQVRNPQWQQQFLNMPLTQRKAIAQNMRVESRQRQQGKSMTIMDVNPQAVDQSFAESGLSVMIHGHTHRPALHKHEDRLRYVLSDWEYDHAATRGDWLEISNDGVISRYSLSAQDHRQKTLFRT